MKTRKLNWLPVLFVALALAAGTTACEEKNEAPESQSIVGIWQEVYESSSWGDGTTEGYQIEMLFAFHFQESNQVTLYANYYEGEVSVFTGEYAYDAATGVLTLAIPDAELLSDTFSAEIEDDELHLLFFEKGYRNDAYFQRISQEELQARIDEAEGNL